MVTLLVILGFSYFILHQDYIKHIDSAEKNTRFVSSLVAKQTESTINELDRLLHSISLQITMNEHYRLSNTQALTERYLTEIKQYNEQIMDLLVLDQQGLITAWTGSVKRPSVTDRQYYSHHIHNIEADLYIGEPLISKVHAGKWFFALSKAVRDDNNQLNHIVVAIVDIEKFQSQISTIERPDLSSLALISRSGNIISRVPNHDIHVGKKVQLPYEVLYKQDRGNFDALSPFDGIDRIVGYTHLNQHNITAFSTLSREAVLSDWYTLRNFILSILIIITTLIFWFDFKIYKARKTTESQRELLSKQAQTDELTGLYNRRHVMQILHNEFQRANSEKTKLSLLMLDIDHFKRINDHYGHAVGDAVLKRISYIMGNVSRKESMIGRIGGEEFLLILPSVTKEDASKLAERLRKTIYDSTLVVDDHTIHCTVSIGIVDCSLDEHLASEEIAMKHADEAMYTAKNTGRNKVIIYPNSA